MAFAFHVAPFSFASSENCALFSRSLTVFSRARAFALANAEMEEKEVEALVRGEAEEGRDVVGDAPADGECDMSFSRVRSLACL